VESRDLPVDERVLIQRRGVTNAEVKDPWGGEANRIERSVGRYRGLIRGFCGFVEI